MRIVFLTSSMGAGGAERVATTLCNAWVARGDSVTLIATFSGGGERPFYRISDAVEFMYLANAIGDRKKGIVSSLRRLAALRKLIVQRQPHVIVSFLPNVNVAAVISTAFLRIPVIICERSDPSSRSYPWHLKLLCKLSYPFANMLTVQTESVARKIREIFPGLGVIRIAPNPLPEAVAEIARSRCSERKILLSLGRLSREKQVDKLVRAFGAVAASFPDWDMYIYGDGPLSANLARQIADEGLAARVLLKGRTDVPWKVMADADAFVLVSAYEGFPNALLEAMGIGLPCVAFDCPSGPREITANGQDAFLVPLNDREGLVRALERIMADGELRAALGRRAQESVRKRFGLPRIMQQWDAFFKEVGAIR